MGNLEPVLSSVGTSDGGRDMKRGQPSSMLNFGTNLVWGLLNRKGPPRMSVSSSYYLSRVVPEARRPSVQTINWFGQVLGVARPEDLLTMEVVS